MKKLYVIGIFTILSIFSLLSNVFAHPGRTDSNGGHYDRSTGIYHYHNGGTTTYYEIEENNDNTKVTVEELLKELREKRSKEEILEDYKDLSIASDEKSNTISDLIAERDGLIAEHYNVIKRLLICFSIILILCMFVCYKLGALYSKNKYMIKK